MLANKDLYGDIEVLEKIINSDETDVPTLLKTSMKIQLLQLKLLHNIRTNSVSLMKHYGIELIKPPAVGRDGKPTQSRE